MAKAVRPGSNPPKWDWSWDEHVLALDLYLAHRGRLPGQAHPDIIALSNFLRTAEPGRVRLNPKYRNENGVHMKLANFRRVDPTIDSEGLPRGNGTEQAVWARYANDTEGLSRAVSKIRESQTGVDHLPPVPEEEDEGAAEGAIQIREHKARERDRDLIKRKKQAVLKAKLQLRCEACDLRFDERYGGHGEGFIEVHHINPIALSKPGRKTRLSDLACVCSNCHRMLHFNGLRTIEWLKTQLRPPSSEQG